MAEAQVSTPAPAAVTAADLRDFNRERPREDATRVAAIQRPDATTTQAGKGSDELAQQLERLTRQVLKNSRLSIQRDPASKDFIYLMIDRDTGEVVRRWPPNSHSDLAEFLRTQTAGIVNRTA